MCYLIPFSKTAAESILGGLPRILQLEAYHELAVAGAAEAGERSQ